jgi:hypothetical protein
MMRVHRLLAAGVLVLSSVVACSFELADVVPDGDGGDGAVDGARDAGGDTVVLEPPSACAAPSCFSLPDGFRPIAFAPKTTDGCPPSYGKPSSVVEGPTLTKAPCSCGCKMTSTPTCVNGRISYTLDLTGAQTCLAGPFSFDAKDAGGCENIGTFNVTNQTDVKYTPPQPDGGACTALVVDPSALSFASSGRTCEPGEGSVVLCSDGRACAPEASAGYAQCIAHDGDVACPAGSAFSVKHAVGSGASIACQGATCACNVTAKCAGSVKFFANNDCTGMSYTAIVDGQCRSEAAGAGSSYTAFEYTGTISNIACNADGGSPGTPVANLDAPVTVCCRP